MKKIKLILITILFLSLNGGQLYAMRVIDFNEYNLNNLKYADRVCLSTDYDNYNFTSNQSHDVNKDGVVDFLEESTFLMKDNEFDFYVGNKKHYKL